MTYYGGPSGIVAYTRATAAAVNANFSAVADSFALLPQPGEFLVAQAGETFNPLPAKATLANQLLGFDADGEFTIHSIDYAVDTAVAAVQASIGEQVVAATVQAGIATTQAQLAQRYATALMLNATVATTAEGLAKYGNGQSFWVRVGSASITAKLYYNNNGVASLLGSLINTGKDNLGRDTLPLALSRLRPPGPRIANHIRKLAAGLVNRTHIGIFGDSICEIPGAEQFAIQQLLGPHYSQTPIYSYVPGAVPDYLGYGQKSTASASSWPLGLGLGVGSTATLRIKYDWNYSFDGSFIEIAPGQTAAIPIRRYGDYCTLPIITEPGASNNVLVQHNTQSVATVAGPWFDPVVGEIDSGHALTGASLIVSADAARGVTTVKLKFTTIAIRNILVTNNGASTVRVLKQGNQVRTAASIGYCNIGVDSNDWVNTTDLAIPIMAGYIRDQAFEMIFVVSNDRLASHQAFLPRLDAAITASGLSPAPAVIIVRNPYNNEFGGTFTDADMLPVNDYCWDFVSTRADWDVIDSMALIGGTTVATAQGLLGPGGDITHWPTEVGQMSIKAWGAPRGYQATGARRAGSDADLPTLLQGTEPRVITAQQAIHFGLERVEMRGMKWTATGKTGSAADPVIGDSGVLNMSTGATANSTVVSRVNDTNAVWFPGGNRSFQLDLPVSVVFGIGKGTANATGKFDAIIEAGRGVATAYVGDLAANGCGWHIDDDKVYGTFYRAGFTPGKSASFYTLPASASVRLIMQVIPFTIGGLSYVEWYVEGPVAGVRNRVFLGRELTNASGNCTCLRYEMTNGAGGGNYSLLVDPASIAIGYVANLTTP